MSDRCSEILRDSQTGNYIPSGRQLPRTPPLTDVKRHLDFCNEDCEEPQQNMQAGTRDNDDNDQNRTFDFNTFETKTGNKCMSQSDDSNSMLKGMKGYQLIPSDLEFIKKMKEEKLCKKLQGDLEEMQRLLKKEMMALELACAAREKAQAELKKFPSCEELTEWITVVLKMTSPSTGLTDLDAKSLLAMVTKENVQRAMDEKRIGLTRMGKMVANMRKREAKERGQLEKQTASEQLKIQRLMSQLSDLKSELAQEEEACKALEMQINTREAPEIKAEVEEPPAAKSQVKRRGKERKEAVKSTKKLQDATNQSKVTDNETAVQRSGKQAAVADAQNAGLRRSKRIASRK